METPREPPSRFSAFHNFPHAHRSYSCCRENRACFVTLFRFKRIICFYCRVNERKKALYCRFNILMGFQSLRYLMKKILCWHKLLSCLGYAILYFTRAGFSYGRKGRNPSL